MGVLPTLDAEFDPDEVPLGNRDKIRMVCADELVDQFSLEPIETFLIQIFGERLPGRNIQEVVVSKLCKQSEPPLTTFTVRRADLPLFSISTNGSPWLRF